MFFYLQFLLLHLQQFALITIWRKLRFSCWFSFCSTTLRRFGRWLLCSATVYLNDLLNLVFIKIGVMFILFSSFLLIYTSCYLLMDIRRVKMIYIHICSIIFYVIIPLILNLSFFYFFSIFADLWFISFDRCNKIFKAFLDFNCDSCNRLRKPIKLYFLIHIIIDT